VLAILEDEQLPARAAALAPEVGRRLSALRELSPAILDVRGRGLLWGVELASAGLAKAWTSAARDRGVLLLAGGPEGRVAQIVPPLTITEPQLDASLAVLADALAAVTPAGASR
jgi:4-aminobutyrate aminotransferase-like enzyme